MSNVITRLEVDTRQYNSALSNAAEWLRRYERSVRDTGGSFKSSSEYAQKFVQSFGQLATESGDAASQMDELASVLKEFSSIYSRMSAAEKRSPIGTGLAQSMDVLERRIENARHELKRFKDDTFDSASVAQGISSLAQAFQTATGAARLLGIDVGNDVEVIAKLQSAAAVANGIKDLGNTLRFATKAQQAFNAALKANPLAMLATAIAAAGTAIYAFYKKSGEAAKAEKEMLEVTNRAADVFKNKYTSSLTDSLTKYKELQTQWNALKTTHERNEFIKNNTDAFNDLGQSVRNTADAENIFNTNSDSVVEGLKKRALAAAKAAQAQSLYQSAVEKTLEIEKIEQQRTDELKDIKGSATIFVPGSGGLGVTQSVKVSETDRKAAVNQKYDQQIQGLKNARDEIERQADALIESAYKGGYFNKTGGKGNNEVKYNPTDKPVKVEIVNDKRTGVGFNPESSAFGENGGMKSIKDLQADLRYFKDLLANAKTQEEYKTATSGIAQTQGAIKAQSLALELDVSIAEAEVMSQAQSLRDSLETYFKDNPLKFNVDSGLAKEGKDARDSWKSAASAVQSVGSAIASIEDPAAKVAGTVAQAIATVALAYADTLAKDGASKSNIFAFIAAAAAATVSMATTIASIHSATGYEQGGIVGGNSYSNDQVPIMANSGELVLTRAMQGNLASQLQGNGGNGAPSRPFVYGSKIVLGVDNWGMEQGRGTLVFSNDLKKYIRK